MRAEVGQSILGGHFVRIRCSPGRNFQLQWRYEDICVAETVANQFNHALAAHDAELDKTRFVELTEQNKQLHEACTAYIKEIFDLKDRLAAAELDKTRFVELTGTNVRLNHEVSVLEARIRVLEAQIGGLKDEAAHSRFNWRRIMAAGPGNVEAAVRILQKPPRYLQLLRRNTHVARATERSTGKVRQPSHGD
jgi:hypothetical protein